jgi:hypothetical protein
VLKHCWIKLRGLIKKAAIVSAGLLGIDAKGLKALLTGETSLKKVNKYRA